MEVYIESEEAAQIIGAAEFILKLIGNAQGRAESYAARRDELKVIEFPGTAKKKPLRTRRSAQKVKLEVKHFRHFRRSIKRSSLKCRINYNKK